MDWSTVGHCSDVTGDTPRVVLRGGFLIVFRLTK